MRRISLSAAILMAVVTGPLSGCAHTGGNFAASRSHKIEAQYDLARLAESDGQLDKARETYEGIYKKDASNADVCHRLGIVHAKQSNYEAAKRYLSEAHKLTPGNPEVLNDWGYACYLSNDLATAEDVFKKALKTSPDNKRATNNLALVYGGMGKLDESYRLFRQANGEAEANSNVAYLYAQHGDGKKALDHYNRALSLKPDLKAAQNGMVAIAEMQQKMEYDRAQIAQKNHIEAEAPVVAQAGGRAQPKVYQELTAARPAPQPEIVKVAQPAVQEVATVRQTSAPTAELPATRTAARTTNNDFEEDLFVDDNVAAPTKSTTQRAVASKSPETVVPAPVPVVATTTLADEFDEPEAKPAAVASQAVITPSRTAQSLANVSDSLAVNSQPGSQVDYVALCPQANDKVKSLLVEMNSQDASKMKLALHKLGELNADGASGGPAARAALGNTDPYVRIHAALALWRTEQNTKETIPVFVAGLRNTDGNVRSFAATALAIGPKVDEVVAPLTATLSDSNPFVRLHSAETLYKYEGQEATSLKALIGHLDHKDANVRWLAIFIMGEVLPKSPEAVEALTLALYDSDNRIRAGAAFALGGLGSEAHAALPELKELISDQNPEVRKSVEDAIQEIQKHSSQASAAR